jgi:hypothetical protein
MSDRHRLTKEQIERLRLFLRKGHGKPRFDDRRA